MLSIFVFLVLFTAASTTPTCGKNEVYTTCGSSPDCPQVSCSDREPECNMMCHAGCVCKDDHVRQNGTCIPTAECVNHCSKNEEFMACGNLCEPLCRDPERDPCGECVKNMCMCKKGFVRDIDGSCTRPVGCMTYDTEE